MSVLIVTEPDDIHAALVKLALEEKGEVCELFFSADMPTKQKNKIYFSDSGYSWTTTQNNSAFYQWREKSIDVIWWRRPRRPFIPAHIHEEDQVFVQKENGVYHDSIPFMFDDTAWWVNPIESIRKTKSKINQLKLAYQCGFRLPETLITNSPEEIKAFIQSHENNPVIYKPFTPQFWAEDEGIKVLYTDKISLQGLPNDEMLQVVPGIYQQYINKKYELRVTCFGAYISAVKIDSQKHASGQTDWRNIPSHELSLSEIDLPNPIKNKIRIFMKKMAVVFGCFDFIVTPEDDIVFLEMNEQGQFLWIEDIVPELRYLDIFTEFLICKTFNFSWEKTGQGLCAATYDAEAQKMVEKNLEHHVYLNLVKRVA